MGITSSTAYPSKWLTAQDIGRNRVVVTINAVRMEEIGSEDGQEKPVAYFVGKEKGMVVNRTNWSILAMDFGDDSDLWLGKKVEIFTERKMFKGKPVMGLSVRAAGQPQAPQQPTPRMQQPQGNQWGDQRPEPPAATQADYGADLDDSIPF